MKPSVVVLSAERPYPLHGGGAYRTASLLHYFSQFADVDLVLLAEGPHPSPVPNGLVRRQTVITLPRHSKTTLARYKRNIRRALSGIPPLIDRLSGLSEQINKALGSQTYDLGIVEHFWCAQYLKLMEEHCGQTVLDLHNVESVLHRSCARVDQPLIALGQLRFALASENLEKQLLPLYSRVLVASSADKARVLQIAPTANVSVYPNALPWVEVPRVPLTNSVVFTANFEYHPNIDAVKYLVSEVWPRVRKRHPEINLRLVGRGDEYVRALVGTAHDIELTGPLPETLSEVASAMVAIAPLRAGSGTRIKIIEAWAASRAVVATALAAEGLEYSDRSLLIASNATNFAEAICSCIENERLRNSLGQAGRETFEQKYCWPKAWEILSIYNLLATTPQSRGYTEKI